MNVAYVRQLQPGTAPRNVIEIEIDAASNNGVDNIREIIDEVRYSPQKVNIKYISLMRFICYQRVHLMLF